MSEVVLEEGQVIGCHTVDAWSSQLQKGLESKKLIVVDFTASWCPPCRFIAPFFAELAKNKTGVIFLKVDVDELQSVAKEWDVEAMPTFVFIKEGKVLERIVGADKDGLQRALEKHTTADTADAPAVPTFVVKEGNVSEKTEGADQGKHKTADTDDA